MSVYVVRKMPVSGTTYLYGFYMIVESKYDDQLQWMFLRGTIEPVATSIDIGEPTLLVRTSVTARQAELLTGLFPPACWDRLREMVQDSAEYTVPFGANVALK